MHADEIQNVFKLGHYSVEIRNVSLIFASFLSRSIKFNFQHVKIANFAVENMTNENII